MPSISFSLFTIIVFLLFIIFSIRFQYSTIPKEREFVLEPLLQQREEPPIEKAKQEPYIPEACRHTDFHWMASDRQYWDGWSSKSMFLRPDGKFTRGDISIQQHEFICVAVLLGPIPAVSAITAEPHTGPSDAIIMSAVNYKEGIKIPVRLYQHHKQSNVYFTEIQFSHAGVYRLETSVEYRSYFWEFPAFHKYRPNRFLSRNKLTVHHGPTQQKVVCNPKEKWMLKDSLWIKQDNQTKLIPKCELKACTLPKRIHVWGDDLIKRNMKLLVDRQPPKEGCSAFIDKDHYDFNSPMIYHEDTLIYIGSINTKIADNSLYWKDYVQETVAHVNTKEANVVLIGVGNEDLASLRQDPRDFEKGFQAFLTFMMTDIYPTQTIVVKTTRWVSKSVNGLNYGRSQAYADIIRSTVSNLSSDRVLLWDTHQLGIKDNECRNHMSLNNYVVSLENSLLSTLFC